MTQSQINKLAMFQACNQYLIENQPVWDAIPVVHSYRHKLSAIQLAIKETALEQDAAQVHISKSQIELKNSIADFMGITDDSFEVYAEDTNNAELLSVASNSVSDYKRLPNEEFEIKVKNMIDNMEKYLPEMADYGFTPDQLENVKADFNQYQEKRGKPRAYKISSRIATQNLKVLFQDAAVILTKMDKVLRRFQLTDPSFYNGYKAARLVINS